MVFRKNKKNNNVFATFVRNMIAPVEDKFDLEKFDESISPNMRALRLSISIADVLVAMGVSVSDVISQCLDITDRYCKRRVLFDISSSQIYASQDRGNDREPLTIMRHSTARTPNYMTVQSIEELIRDIKHGKLKLAEAEERFESIISKPSKYPYWLIVCGSGLISAGIGVMYGAKIEIVIIMFVVAALVSYMLRFLSHQKVPVFFAQIFSSIFIVVVAGFVRWIDLEGNISIIDGVNSRLIVVGGIVMLVAGLAIVSAVSDAIDEFYVTANARILKVVMMTIGIVAGVLIGLYIMKKMGLYVDVTAIPATKVSDLQYVGAFLISAGYALSMQTRIRSIALAGGVGVLSWYIYNLTLSVGGAYAAVTASAVAATIVGAVATIFTRLWRIPSVALMTAGIIVLVPGLTLYNGLFSMISGLGDSFSILSNAALIALAVASGVSFGHLIARPVNMTLVRARNALPKRYP